MRLTSLTTLQEWHALWKYKVKRGELTHSANTMLQKVSTKNNLADNHGEWIILKKILIKWKFPLKFHKWFWLSESSWRIRKTILSINDLLLLKVVAWALGRNDCWWYPYETVMLESFRRAHFSFVFSSFAFDHGECQLLYPSREQPTSGTFFEVVSDVFLRISGWSDTHLKKFVRPLTTTTNNKISSVRWWFTPNRIASPVIGQRKSLTNFKQKCHERAKHWMWRFSIWIKWVWEVKKSIRNCSS